MSNQSTLGAEPAWRMSKYCNNGNCAEMAILPDGMVGIRNNKNPNVILRMTPDDWKALKSDILRG